MRFYRQSTVSRKTLKDLLSKNLDYSEDEKNEIIEEIFEIDPDKIGHKNSVWLVKQYLITDGYLPKNLTKLLKTFNTLCDNNRIEDKDLKNYRSIKDLRDVVEREAERGISKKESNQSRLKIKRASEGSTGKLAFELLRKYRDDINYRKTPDLWGRLVTEVVNNAPEECYYLVKYGIIPMDRKDTVVLALKRANEIDPSTAAIIFKRLDKTPDELGFSKEQIREMGLL